VWLVHLYNFILDDAAYRRAHYHYPAITRHQRPRSTFAAAEFMLIA
jgi:hypothetical protein